MAQADSAENTNINDVIQLYVVRLFNSDRTSSRTYLVKRICYSSTAELDRQILLLGAIELIDTIDLGTPFSKIELAIIAARCIGINIYTSFANISARYSISLTKEVLLTEKFLKTFNTLNS